MSNNRSRNNSSMSDHDDPMTFVIGIRMDRPIESCELIPYGFLNVKGAGVDNIGRAKALEANPHVFTYKWYRGAKSPLCNNETCVRWNNADTSLWCRESLGVGPLVRCALCENRYGKKGAGREFNTFCSSR